MKIATNYKVLPPNTVQGYTVQVINTLSTFDKEEFDDYVKFLKENVGDGLFYRELINKTCTIDTEDFKNAESKDNM